MTPRRIDIAELGRLLDERQMSLRDLQLTTGLSWSFVKYLAKGQRNPSGTSALLLAFALGVPAEAFLITHPVNDGASNTSASFSGAA